MNSETNIQSVVEKRVNWENLRHEYGKYPTALHLCHQFIWLLKFIPYLKALRFSTIVPLTLPKNAAVMSNYSISRNSVLSEQELLQRNRKDKELFRILREVRSLSRTLANKRTTLRIARDTAEVRPWEMSYYLHQILCPNRDPFSWLKIFVQCAQKPYLLLSASMTAVGKSRPQQFF